MTREFFSWTGTSRQRLRIPYVWVISRTVQLEVGLDLRLIKRELLPADLLGEILVVPGFDLDPWFLPVMVVR
jgi:hypothetical protein